LARQFLHFAEDLGAATGVAAPSTFAEQLQDYVRRIQCADMCPRRRSAALRGPRRRTWRGFGRHEMAMRRRFWATWREFAALARFERLGLFSRF
jgi:hypothetical protein